MPFCSDSWHRYVDKDLLFSTHFAERLYIVALQYVPEADEDVDKDLLQEQEQVRRTGNYGYAW